MTAAVLDTSVAIALLMKTHRHHSAAQEWIGNRDAVLAGHAAAETYSVLTRLAGAALAAADAATIMEARFGPPLTLAPQTVARLPRLLADAGVSGGAVYDALVALAALDHDAELATSDARARSTYDALGARYVIV